jgi:hypothetical protein
MREYTDEEIKAAQAKWLKKRSEELSTLTLELIVKSFPDLVDMTIDTFIVPDKEIPDAYLQYSSMSSSFYIDICETLASQNDKIVIGGIVHELCHIARDRFGNWFEQFIYDHNLRYRRLVERNTDLDTIIRGYGKELLAYTEWHFSQVKREELISEYEGITFIELQRIIYANQ